MQKEDFNKLVQQAREADLLDYFQKSNYTVKRYGKEYYVQEIAGLCINPEEKKWCCHYVSGRNGSIEGRTNNSIDCLTLMLGMSFNQAVFELTGNDISTMRSYDYPKKQAPEHTSPPVTFVSESSKCRYAYRNPDGSFFGTKTVISYSNGSEESQWSVSDKSELNIPLYHADVLHDNPSEDNTVFITENERDADILAKWDSIPTTTIPEGREFSKWNPSYNKDLQGRDIIILATGSESGKDYANRIARNLLTVAKSVKVVPTSQIWNDCPKQYGIADIARTIGDDVTSRHLTEAIQRTEFCTLESLAHSEQEIQKYSPSHKTKRQLEMPPPSSNMRRLFAYLCQTRKIPAAIVEELVHSQCLYQSQKTEKMKSENAVFVHRNEKGEVVGGEIQGINSFKRFKGIVAGTSDSVFMFTPFPAKDGKLRRAYIFESAIDLMSFYTLCNKKNKLMEGAAFISMAGLKPTIPKQLQAQGVEIISCVDNDEKGRQFEADNGFVRSESVKKHLDNQGFKDWNEMLVFQSENGNLNLMEVRCVPN